MRTLHLFSNFKWTGPAEPALALAAGLVAAGEHVVFRSSGYTKGAPVNQVAERARARGLHVATDLQLSKHRSPWRDACDARRLHRILDREHFDLVHCHLANDARIAERALRGSTTPLCRTLYETEPDRLRAGEVRRLDQARRVFVFSRRMQRALLEGGIDNTRLVHVEPAVDLERFRPGTSRRRIALGLDTEDFVAGIVARVQPQRRFDLLLEVAERMTKACSRFRLLIIGRGSKLERTAREPAERRGLLGKTVFFPGYFEGDDYPDLLRALDVKIFLVPGTDGTARAVREAMASGLPVVSTRRGMLPELIHDGVTGRTLPEEPEVFVEALLQLWRAPSTRLRMGEAARREACERFDLHRQVAVTREAYRSALEEAA